MNNLTKVAAGVLVLLAIALGIFAFILGRRPAVVIPPTLPGITSEATHPVVVAQHALVPGKALVAADMAVVNVPTSPSGSFTNVNAVLGKIPRTSIAAGMPITEDGLAGGIPLQLAAGERGVAVPVDEVVGVGNAIVPGDYVDVFFSLRQGQDITRTQARLMLSRLKVLAYGADTLGPNGVVRATPATTDQARPAPARTAVLAVPVEDVDSLILASQSGKLTLALRQPTDISVPEKSLFPTPAGVLPGRNGLAPAQLAALAQPDNKAFAGLDLGNLSGDAKAANSMAVSRQADRPVRRVSRTSAGAGNSVEIIRGTERQNVAF